MGRKHTPQKALIHQYARLAGMTRAEYVSALRQAAGVETSKDLTQETFEAAMATIEAILWYRIDEGIVPDPNRLGRRMERDYWRRRVPKVGMINSRLKFKLTNLWSVLSRMLAPEKRSEAYLAGIISATTGDSLYDILSGGRIIWTSISARSAHMAIEAIKDRIKYATRSARETAAHHS